MLLSFVVLFIVFLLANSIEALAGFGSTILTLTFGSFFYSIEHLLVVIVPLNVLLSLWTCLKYYKQINFQILLKVILPLCLAGMAAGIFIFNQAPENVIKAIFAYSITLVGLHGLYRSFYPAKEIKTSPLLSYIYLLLGGVMQGLYASGGPFIVAYASRTHFDKAQFRTTLSCLWLILNLVLCGKFIYSEQITQESLTFSAQLMPAFFIGTILGFKLHDRLSQKVFIRIVYILLAVAGICRVYLG